MQRTHRLLNRSLVVEPMDLEKIDICRIQPGERGIYSAVYGFTRKS